LKKPQKTDRDFQQTVAARKSAVDQRLLIEKQLEKQVDKQQLKKQQMTIQLQQTEMLRRWWRRRRWQKCTFIRNRKRCNKCNKFWFRWSWF
jgi:hypothetical protein